MFGKAVLLFLGQALFLKAVLSQCIPRDVNFGCGSFGVPGNGFAALPGYNLPPSSLNKPVDLILSTGCPSQPIGVSISADDLIIDGCLNLQGVLPFTAAILVDGIVPNIGEADVLYSCGNGNIGIANEFGSENLYANGLVGGNSYGLNRIGNCGCVY